ncbi:hypothetical protein KYB31_10730 [Clostridium felsineum]|uniref:hypothetical protein n=1 Tax=Clostridium felsineum TaxID=36839 RepID=UPI00098BD48E|nr:hypothetical protein [Clostridium felsineum]MCR3759459.1 hypothetical protein [Clostridium felsineum]URZ17519.1 hypothetical protein CLFE_035720 [Clostridium felsineum DSM 794]
MDKTKVKIDKDDNALEDQSLNKIMKQAEPTELMRESANLLFRIPVFLSHPSRLNTIQQQFVDAIIRQIRRALLFPRTLPISEQYPETPLTNIRRMIASSYGMVSLNLRQRRVSLIENNLNQPIGGDVWEGSPFAQIEPGMAYQYGLPLLLIREIGVEQNGIWSFGIAPFLILEWDSTAVNPIETFFRRNDWKSIFQNWIGEVRTGYYIQTQPQFQYSCKQDN